MKIDIDVPVVVRGCVGRASYRYNLATVPREFELPELSSSDVPMVLAVENDHGGGRTRHEFFGFDGAIYRPTDSSVTAGEAKGFAYPISGNAAKVHPLFQDATRRICDLVTRLRTSKRQQIKFAMGPQALGDMLVEYSNREPFTPPSLQSLALRDMSDSEVEHEVGQFEKELARLIVVGGKVMIRQQEPLAAIESKNRRAGSLRDADWYARLWFHDRPEPWFPQGRTRSSVNDMANGGFLSLRDADRFEEIVDVLEQAKGFPIERQRTLVNVEIVDPEYLRTSTEAISLVDIADGIRHAFVSNLSSKGNPQFNGSSTTTAEHLDQIAPETFIAYKSIVDGLKRSDEYGVDTAVEEGLAHFSTLDGKTAWTLLSKDEPQIAEIAARLDAWHSREVGFNPTAFSLGR